MFSFLDSFVEALQTLDESFASYAQRVTLILYVAEAGSTSMSMRSLGKGDPLFSALAHSCKKVTELVNENTKRPINSLEKTFVNEKFCNGYYSIQTICRIKNKAFYFHIFFVNCLNLN